MAASSLHYFAPAYHNLVYYSPTPQDTTHNPLLSVADTNTLTRTAVHENNQFVCIGPVLSSQINSEVIGTSADASG